MDPAKVLKFCRALGTLKHLKRTGWVKRDVVPEPETVAGHMYRMAALALLLDPKAVDRDRCIRMSLVHDIGEAIIGDITPVCGVPDEEKFRREKAAVESLAALVGGDQDVGREIYELWMEYEQGQTAEAKAVKGLDKFDMLCQAHEYEVQTERPGHLQEFFDNTSKAVLNQNERVSQWNAELETERGDTAADPQDPGRKRKSDKVDENDKDGEIESKASKVSL